MLPESQINNVYTKKLTLGGTGQYGTNGIWNTVYVDENDDIYISEDHRVIKFITEGECSSMIDMELVWGGNSDTDYSEGFNNGSGHMAGPNTNPKNCGMV